VWPEGLEFQSPWLLLFVLPGIALVAWKHRRRRHAPTLVYPSLAAFHGLPRTWRLRLRATLPVLEALAVVLLAGAAARPRLGEAHTLIQNQGIAIQMVLDRSSSMEKPMVFGDRSQSRIEIVKQVFAEFVSGKGELRGRRGDLIGLTTFARFPEESCPLLGQHEALLTAVGNIQTIEPAVDRYGAPIPHDRLPKDDRTLQRRAREDGWRENPLNATAIGDGIRRAVYSLVTAEEDLSRAEDEGGYKIQSKVIIALTDGENNAGSDPVEAGQLAAHNGIRVYYILFQEKDVYQQTIFGPRVKVERSREELLADPARVTGDPKRAFLATDGDVLREIYSEIDRLEKSDVGRIEYRSYQERYHWPLLLGFAALVAAFLLGETLLRRIP
jgi:Ca-activated chloride channel family protein